MGGILRYRCIVDIAQNIEISSIDMGCSIYQPPLQYRYYAVAVHILYRYSTGTVQVQYRYYTVPVQVLYRYYTGTVQELHRYCTGKLHVMYRYWSGTVQIQYQ